MFARPEAISFAQKKQILINLGLDRNPFVQYFDWVSSMLRGDFGTSFIDGESVSKMVFSRITNTLVLCLVSFFFISILSIFFGLLSAVYKNKSADFFINFFSFTLNSMPHFLFALLLIFAFSVSLNWLPSSGVHDLGQNGISLKHLILPVLSIALPHVATNMKFVRDVLVYNLNLDFIQCAYARGLGKRSIYALALKNAMPSIAKYFGTLVGSIFAGSYIIEAVFVYPGIGELALKSIIAKDYPVALVVIMITAVIVVVFNLLAEILAIALDKRNL